MRWKLQERSIFTQRGKGILLEKLRRINIIARFSRVDTKTDQILMSIWAMGTQRNIFYLPTPHLQRRVIIVYAF